MTPSTNGMAVAAMVLGIVGTVFGVLPIGVPFAIICGVLALVFGLIARGRAKEMRTGAGMAVAGIILGLVAITLGVLWITLFAVSVWPSASHSQIVHSSPAR